MYREYLGEWHRLNQRYETVKNNPNWSEDMLNILITAQFDYTALINTPEMREWFGR